MKATTTKITITRETVRTVLERYLEGALIGSHELKEFQIHRNGSIEMTVADKPAELPLETPSSSE